VAGKPESPMRPGGCEILNKVAESLAAPCYIRFPLFYPHWPCAGQLNPLIMGEFRQLRTILLTIKDPASVPVC